MKITSVPYWRQNTSWSVWLGKKGKVILSTLLQISSPDQKAYLPYSFVLVDFGGEKREFMGIKGEVFESGDVVECVFRKVSSPSEEGIIHYGIKVKKI